MFLIPNIVIASSQDNGYLNTQDRAFNGAVWSPTQFNLTTGDKINYVTLKTFYHDLIFDHIPTGLADDTGFTGAVFATKISNGDVPADARITKIGIFVNSFSNAVVRVKVFTDNNNVIVANSTPDLLVGESDSIPVIATGEQDFALKQPTPVPTAPNTSSFWVGFEETSTTFHMSDAGNGKWCTLGHTYGNGPASMAGCGLSTESFRVKIYYTEGSDGFVRVKIFNSTSNTRTELLGQSTSVFLRYNGTNNIPVSATVGPSGQVYAGFETLNGTQWFYTDIFGAAIKCAVTHTYGTGPNPFGACSNVVDGPFMGVIYNVVTNNTQFILSPISGPSGSLVSAIGKNYHASETISMTFDGNVLSLPNGFQGTDHNGNFNTTITIPLSISGNHNIEACDTSGTCASTLFIITSATISNFASGTQSGNVTTVTPIITTDTQLLATKQDLYFANGTLVQEIIYTAPIFLNTNIFPIPTTLQPFTYTVHSTLSFYETVTTTDGVNTYTTKSQTLTFSPVIGFTPIQITPGQQNFTISNPNQINILYTRVDRNPTHTDLLVSYPNAFNLTCNLAYQFAQSNHTYFPLPHTTIPNNRLQSNFTFINSTSDIITSNCTDIHTHEYALYILTISNFPLKQQIKEFRSGDFGTHGQFGIIDIVSLIGILVAMIGLSRVNEAAGIIIAVIMLGFLAYFEVITWPTLLTGVIATVVMIAVVSTKKLPWSQ